MAVRPGPMWWAIGERGESGGYRSATMRTGGEREAKAGSQQITKDTAEMGRNCG